MGGSTGNSALPLGEFCLLERHGYGLFQSDFRAGIVIKITRTRPGHFGSSGYIQMETPERTEITYAVVLSDPFIDRNGEPTVLAQLGTRRGSPRGHGPESFFSGEGRECDGRLVPLSLVGIGAAPNQAGYYTNAAYAEKISLR